ncbi:hypothetical protein MKEN_00701000 [Mycena kentingensis (nom. inval.)]|nr:hypothetical protein MKEN_00701000 [Mycena kentingensis (nom. inval.)]
MTSSSSPAAASDSRSDSPETPSPEPYPFDSVNTDFSSWYTSDQESILPTHPSWLDPSLLPPQKIEETEMLHLDDLIQRNAYDDSPYLDSPDALSRPQLLIGQQTFIPSPPNIPLESSTHAVPRNDRILASQPVPSSAPSLRRQSAGPHQAKIIYPPKDSCYGLAIVFPNTPEGGVKSRVETQIRTTLELADSSSSSDPANYNCVGSWKYLQLPEGTTTKRRTRKQGKVDPSPEDILHLSATLSCASSPDTRVYSCTSCQKREAKRLAKKLAARVRPSRSETDSGDDTAQRLKNKPQEDTTSIIQFNCAEIQDFAKGTVALPLRLTCYCRHHREKVGFNIHFSMTDHLGRIVASGTMGPVMITDDHKTPASRVNDLVVGASKTDSGHSQTTTRPDTKAPSKRNKDVTASASTKKRPKPYDVPPRAGRRSRETSVVDSLPSPSSSHADTRASTPNTFAAIPQLQPPSSLESDSSGDVPATPPDYPMIVEEPDDECQPLSSAPQTAPLSLFNQPQPSQSLTSPTIHRLIPNCGPTRGGTEVTILGANFHPSLQLDCVFGDVISPSTHRWSDNTLVCILPPRATPGVVPVWFNNFPEPETSTSAPAPIFTYSDDSDRALMELALQVVGLKMTGKIEDAKNIAMRIVGNVAGDNPGQNGIGDGQIMQLADGSDFQTRVIQLLSTLVAPLDLPTRKSISLDRAISHPSSSGQTLLHLAAFLGFDGLVTFLVTHGIDLDHRDRSGCTALHFAAISGSRSCAELLLRAGADVEIVDARGKSPQEVASVEGLFTGYIPQNSGETSDEEEDEAHWGDAEADSDEDQPRPRLSDRRRRIATPSTRPPRHALTPRSSSSSLTATPSVATKSKATEVEDEKQAATLVSLIQRTLAQLPAPQLPHIPGLAQLPEMPAVPWAALPQLPVVFPVFVPWPAFLGGSEPREGDDPETKAARVGAMSTRAAQELKATWEAWEKWLALAARVRPTEEAPPPMYTPRETPETIETPEVSQEAEETLANEDAPPTPSGNRHVGYPPVNAQEVDAYGYMPMGSAKKHDRMLLFFWLPILLISLLWAVHSGARMVFQSLKGAIPLSLKSGVRT